MSNQEMDVTHIAKLARIALTDAEAAEFQDQLADVLGYIDKLSEVDVSGIDVESNLPFGPLRPDEARPGLGQDAVVANAPESAEGQVRVPKVVDAG